MGRSSDRIYNRLVGRESIIEHGQQPANIQIRPAVMVPNSQPKPPPSSKAGK